MKRLFFSLHSQQKRILAFLIAISLFFCALLIRLSIVQIVNGEWLQSKATDQWTRDLPLAPERGKIYDANGATLAVSYTTYNIYVRGRQVAQPETVANFLSDILNIPYETMYAKVTNKNVSEVLIKMQVEKNIASKIEEKAYSGIYLSENTKRYYPYGNLLTQLLGFTSIDNTGQAGIEAYFNDSLKGTDGKSLVQSDLQGKELENTLKYYIPAINGMNMTLTIDAQIQILVEKTLEKLMIEQKSKSASCIIMKAKTGEIVSMSTKPSFDLNNVPRDNIASLMEITKNKSIVDVYEPGSTFKVLTMAMCLESEKAHLTDGFYCPGYRLVDGQKIKCWKSIGHGSQNLTDGLCNSCNCVFMDLAGRLGVDKYYEFAKKFGFGSQTEIDFYGESGGILMNKESVKNVDLARMGFGQAIAMTQLQLITAICSVVNGGNLMQPYFVKEIISSDGLVTMSNTPTVKRRVVSEKTSQTINMMLEEVVSKTAKLSFVPGYCVGGKTGTTQKYSSNGIADGKYISSFIGTYPANNPEYVILITVDEPGNGAYYGSIVASPYAKEILAGIFDYKNIKPVNLENDYKKVEKTITMPNVVGLSLSKACAKLAQLNLTVEIQGEGGIVKKQIAPAGAMMFENENVILFT